MLKKDHLKEVNKLHREIAALKQQDRAHIERIKELNEQLYDTQEDLVGRLNQVADLNYMVDRLSLALENTLKILNGLTVDDDGDDYDRVVTEIRNHANEVLSEFNTWRGNHEQPAE